jgi:hypothetical protein
MSRSQTLMIIGACYCALVPCTGPPAFAFIGPAAPDGYTVRIFSATLRIPK